MCLPINKNRRELKIMTTLLTWYFACWPMIQNGGYALRKRYSTRLLQTCHLNHKAVWIDRCAFLPNPTRNLLGRSRAVDALDRVEAGTPIRLKSAHLCCCCSSYCYCSRPRIGRSHVYARHNWCFNGWNISMTISLNLSSTERERQRKDLEIFM